MLARSDFEALLPHAGRMCLLDRVLRWDADSIHAASAGHRDPAHPLARAGRLHALHLCEYGAQAMALHGGLLARAEGGRARPGLLVSLRSVELTVARIDDLPGELELHAERLAAAAAAWQYRFEARHAGRLLAAGRAVVAFA